VIEECIGRGGGGEVYRAFDPRLERRVAIKVLPGAISSPRWRERFRSEMKALAGLRHPHICEVFDTGTEDGREYLVMEHLDGRTLAAELRRRKPAIGDCLLWAGQLAAALKEAHGHGIAHLDLKPANVFVTPYGIKLLDFGVARVIAEIGVSTEDQGFGGTLPYMAPEQVRGDPVDHRADIFAFGAVLYEMAAGRRAFEGATPASVIKAVLEAEPPPLQSLRREAPEELEDVVRRCLAKESRLRFQSIEDAAAKIGEIPRRSSRHGAARAVASLAVLVLAALWLALPGNAPKAASPDPAVLELYNRGKQADETNAALRYFERVVLLAPNFGPGWVALGNAYMWMAASGNGLAPAEAMRRARSAAETALRVEPRRGEAHELLGHLIAYNDWNLEAAERHLRMAVSLAPRSISSHIELASLLSKTGRHREAVERCRTALKLDPLFYQTNVALAGILYSAGFLEEARSAAEETLRLRENSVMGLYYLGRIELRRGRPAEALRYFEMSRKYSLDPSHAAGATAFALDLSGRRPEAEQMRDRLSEARRSRYVSPVRLSQVYLALGDVNGALDLLEEGARQRDFSMLSLRNDDLFDSLRQEPRFVDLLRNVGLQRD
jgi:serine/threonine-protein kinase